MTEICVTLRTLYTHMEIPWFAWFTAHQWGRARFNEKRRKRFRLKHYKMHEHVIIQSNEIQTMVRKQVYS